MSDLPAPLLTPYTREQIAFSIQAWPMRAAEELRSALVFRALTQASRAAGWPARWTHAFAAVVRDELRHAQLCATIGARLGAALPRYDATLVRRRVAEQPDPASRALSLLMVEDAIGETVSMTMFRAGRRGAVEPLTRAGLTSILGDEIRHARLGWSALTSLLADGVLSDRDALQEQATRGLASTEQQVAVPALRRLESGEPFDPAYAALGVLNPEVRVEAFYDAIERLVLPRLTQLGLDGQRAWQERYRTGTAG
jgi:hypothetical protein